MKLLLVVITLYCYSDAAVIQANNDINKRALATTDTTQNTSNDDFNVKTHLIDVLRGRDGRDGLPGLQGEKGDKGEQGPPGPQGKEGQEGPVGQQGPSGGGAVYTRWGRTVCPNTKGTTQVYKGLVAGTPYDKSGGGANYLCITEEPEYLSSSIPKWSGDNDFAVSNLFGTEYELPGLGSPHDHNVPCVVCHTSQRSSKLMIPGKISCPTSWTEEYEGYLVSDRSHDAHKHSVVYECMDKAREIVPGEARNTDGALFYLVGAVCNVGLPCPPFVANRPITCVVCTK